MALKQNINYIYFKGKHLVTSKSQYQYNHGQFLYFADLDLPQTFEVHFSNRDRGDSKPQVGSNKLVEIPDEYYWSGALMIYAWIYLHTGKDDGETVYEVRIPLSKRAKPTDEEPLPQQQGVIDRTIAELNNAVNVTTENANKTEADKTQVANIKNEVVTLKEEIDSTATTVTQKAQEAVNAANASETSAQNSARYENSAHNYSDEAKQYAQSAFESKNIANQKAEVATNASTEAMGYRDEALEAKNQAVQAKQNIVDYRDETKGYRDETLTAKNDAQTIKSDVQSLKTQIDKTATDVEINALDAKSSADLSYRSAISADNASLSASQFADEASDFADSASQSASQAEEFKNQSATNVTHYPKVVDGYWYIWDASKNDYVNTNVDARGVKGDKGDVGETGNGIENTVLNSDYTLTITFTDGTSYTTPSIRGEKGLKGDVGNGIASTVLNNDYTLTINFTDGTQYTTPPIRGKQGEKGDQGETGDSGVYIGTDEPTDENVDVWIDTDGTAENFVNDVQINGTSIVNEGVANIPYGSNDNYGLMKASSTNGIFASGGVLSINNASESDIKGGTEELKPITPNREHTATFYGLSKAAGVDEKNSTLSVGEYTDNAKDAIRGMIGAASDEELSSIKENLSIFSEQINEVSVVLNATIANINGNYTLYPNENERIICFPVTSEKTYTVFKGYVMPYARIAYCASVPQLNSVVTGYGDFSSVDTYKTFTATQTGYACVKIHALTDAETIAQAMEKCLAYEGSYNVDCEQKSTILSNILTLNDTNVGSLIDRTNNIEHVNIIGGKIQGIISDNVIIASNTLAVTLWCPVVAGKRYTIDKKYNSAYTRIGYTSTVPKVGSAVTNYTIADGSNGRIAYTFTALESGYAVLFVSNSTQELADLISANAIVYEGDYHEFYDRGTCKLSDNVANANRVFYCGADRELDTLVKGITEATKYMDSVLYVDAGTYDLVEEFGQDYFDNATETTYGLILKNRIHVVFSSNSKVICHYNGDNQYAHSIFSPFNARAYGFTLENLNLQCSNCRYAVHDELASSPNQYKSEYLNCKMSIDNSANADWSSHHVIGGGLGANGEIVIRNCVFGSDDATIRWGVSYHIPSATSVTSYRSTLLIENCYFDTGAITLQTVDNMPESTSDNSEYMIVGNSFPTKYSGTDAQGVYNTLTHSANVREWNNVIRDAVS